MSDTRRAVFWFIGFLIVVVLLAWFAFLFYMSPSTICETWTVVPKAWP